MRVILVLSSIAFLSLAQAQNEVVSAGYGIPLFPVVARGQVVTLFVRGLTVPDAVATGLPLPTTLAGVSVGVRSYVEGYPDRLPIFRIRSYDFCAGRFPLQCPLTHVTVQIPTDTTCLPGPLEHCIGEPVVIMLTLEENGVPGQEFPIGVVDRKPRILDACDTIFGSIGGICYPLVAHADGTVVNGTNPARPGETVVIYAVGLGGTNPIVKTGEASPSPAPSIDVLTLPLIVSHRLELPPGSPAPPVIWAPVEGWRFPLFVGLVPGYVGLYQINVTLPDRLPERIHACGGEFDPNARIAIGAGLFGPADGETFADLCVEP